MPKQGAKCEKPAELVYERLEQKETLSSPREDSFALMSFSSTLSRTPPKERRQDLSLSEVLFQFGFEPAKTRNYDWMTAYPDAVPLLEAIRTHLEPSSILSTTEAEKLRGLSLSQKHVSPAEIIEAGEPLNEDPTVIDLKSRRKCLLDSARNRVQLLRAQKGVLQDALRRRQADNLSAAPSLKAGGQYRAFSEKAPQLLSTVEVLKQYTVPDSDILRSESDIVRFCGLETKHSEEIACVITKGFPRDLRQTDRRELELSIRTKQAIDTNAKLRHMQCIYRGLLIRDAAMIASLGTNDGRYLEMTASSMLSLIKEIRNNGAKAMQLKAKHASEAARESLRNDVSSFSLSERVSQQNAYIDAMRQSIALYLEQRQRIHCLQALANRVAIQRNRATELLRAITPDLSCVTINDGNVPSNVTVSHGAEERQNNNSMPQNEDQDQHHCQLCETSRYSLKELENSVFSSHVENFASRISSITTNTGNPSSWLILSSNPRYSSLIKELEGELGKNAAVLEALWQKKRAIVDKESFSAPGESPSRSWISRINSSRSRSPMSSSCSSSSLR